MTDEARAEFIDSLRWNSRRAYESDQRALGDMLIQAADALAASPAPSEAEAKLEAIQEYVKYRANIEDVDLLQRLLDGEPTTMFAYAPSTAPVRVEPESDTREKLAAVIATEVDMPLSSRLVVAADILARWNLTEKTDRP